MQVHEVEFKTAANATPVLFFSDTNESAACFRFRTQRLHIAVPRFDAETVDLSVITDTEVISALENQLLSLTGQTTVAEDTDERTDSSEDHDTRHCTDKEKAVIRDRKQVLQMLRHQPQMTLKNISVRVGRSLKFVKEIDKLRTRFETNPLRDSERTRTERRTLIKQTVEETVTENKQAVSRDIKLRCLQRGLVVSRESICRKLRESGRKWRLNKSIIKKKFTKTIKPEQKTQLRKICQVVASLHRQPGSTVMWEDEMKFPVSQVAKKLWGLQNEPGVERTADTEPCITAVVICDKDGFKAIQFFERELTSEDYQFFLMSCLHRFRTEGVQKLKIIQDNAPWHSQKEGPAKQLLSRLVQPSIPGWPMLNFIENTFSPVRLKYRSSIKGTGLSERSRNIFNIFKNCNQTVKFEGSFRSYIRTLISISKTAAT